MKKAKGFMLAVGIVSIALATLGLLYNSSTLRADFSDIEQENELPYFYPAFYTMSFICIICYIILLICGIQFVRLHTGVFWIFAGVIIFEIIYFFTISIMWLIPNVGPSIAAATGIANGGLSFQIFVLFPLWAPFIAGWATTKISKPKKSSNQEAQLPVTSD